MFTVNEATCQLLCGRRLPRPTSTYTGLIGGTRYFFKFNYEKEMMSIMIFTSKTWCITPCLIDACISHTRGYPHSPSHSVSACRSAVLNSIRDELDEAILREHKRCLAIIVEFISLYQSYSVRPRLFGTSCED